MSQRTPSHCAGDAVQFADQRLLQRDVAVVQLQRVRPSREVRISPVREDARRAGHVHACPVLRRGRDLRLGALDEELRVRLHPHVVGRDVVRHEVQHQPEPSTTEAVAQSRERLVAAEVGVHVVVLDREAGPGHVRIPEVGQDAVVLGQPLGVGCRHPACGLTRLPHAEEPDEVEAVVREPIELRIRHVVERRLPAERGTQFRQADARVDLEQRRIAGRGHCRVEALPPTCSRTRRSASRSFSVVSIVRRVHPAEQVHQPRDDPRPAGLVTGAEAGAVVAVEVLVEQDVVTPVRVVLELLASRRTPGGGRCRHGRRSPSAVARSPWRPRTASCGCRIRSGTPR